MIYCKYVKILIPACLSAAFIGVQAISIESSNSRPVLMGLPCGREILQGTEIKLKYELPKNTSEKDISVVLAFVPDSKDTKPYFKKQSVTYKEKEQFLYSCLSISGTYLVQILDLRPGSSGFFASSLRVSGSSSVRNVAVVWDESRRAFSFK